MSNKTKDLMKSVIADTLKQVKQIEADGLNVELEIRVSVLDADGCIVAKISTADKFIEFQHGFYEKGRNISCISRLLDLGYRYNHNLVSLKQETVYDIKLNRLHRYDLEF